MFRSKVNPHLSPLARLRTFLYSISAHSRMYLYRRIWGMDLGNDLRIARTAKLDRTHPQGVHIGHSTLVSFDAAILTHDFVQRKHVHTYIGSFCFIGARSVIMPGVRIGDHCIIGAGSVVTADIPANSIAVGNPARVLRSGVVTGRFGIIDESWLHREENTRAVEAYRLATGRDASPAAQAST